MSTVTVYQFMMYDVANDTMRKSRRWATRNAVQWLGGELLKETAAEVDSSQVGQEIDGRTAIDFNPHRRADFQSQVMA